jgi:hypothetical protein
MLNTSSVFGDRLLYVTTIEYDTIIVLDCNDWKDNDLNYAHVENQNLHTNLNNKSSVQ